MNANLAASRALCSGPETGVTMISPRLVAKIESEEPTLRLAVLIDADNAHAAVIAGLLAEIARFGEATVRKCSIASNVGNLTMQRRGRAIKHSETERARLP